MSERAASETDLWQFTQHPAPRVARKKQIMHPDGYTSIGWVVKCRHRDGMGYVSPRYPEGSKDEHHFFRRVGGYGISISKLREIRRYGVQYIFIQERGEGADGDDVVYEFGWDQYDDAEVIEEMAGDPQAVVPIGDARGLWEGHAKSLWSWTPSPQS